MVEQNTAYDTMAHAATVVPGQSLTEVDSPRVHILPAPHTLETVFRRLRMKQAASLASPPLSSHVLLHDVATPCHDGDAESKGSGSHEATDGDVSGDDLWDVDMDDLDSMWVSPTQQKRGFITVDLQLAPDGAMGLILRRRNNSASPRRCDQAMKQYHHRCSASCEVPQQHQQQTQRQRTRGRSTTCLGVNDSDDDKHHRKQSKKSKKDKKKSKKNKKKSKKKSKKSSCLLYTSPSPRDRG